MDFKNLKHLALMVLLRFTITSAFGAKQDSEKEPRTLKELLRLPEGVGLDLLIDGKRKSTRYIMNNANFQRIADEFGVACLSMKPINDEMEDTDLLYNEGTFTELTVQAYLEHGEDRELSGRPGRKDHGRYHLNVHGSKTAMIEAECVIKGNYGNELKKKHFPRNTEVSVIVKYFKITTPFNINIRG